MTPPNILVIMADQLAPHFTGAYGHEVVKTPHLELWPNAGCDLMQPISIARFAPHRAFL